jgi:hypothetical protein
LSLLLMLFGLVVFGAAGVALLVVAQHAVVSRAAG